MKISTMYPRVIVGSTQYEFGTTNNPNEYIGEVPDDIGEILIKAARRPHEFRKIVEEPKVEIHAEPMDKETAELVQSFPEPKRGKKSK